MVVVGRKRHLLAQCGLAPGSKTTKFNIPMLPAGEPKSAPRPLASSSPNPSPSPSRIYWQGNILIGALIRIRNKLKTRNGAPGPQLSVPVSHADIYLDTDKPGHIVVHHFRALNSHGHLIGRNVNVPFMRLAQTAAYPRCPCLTCANQINPAGVLSDANTAQHQKIKRTHKRTPGASKLRPPHAESNQRATGSS